MLEKDNKDKDFLSMLMVSLTPGHSLSTGTAIADESESHPAETCCHRGVSAVFRFGFSASHIYPSFCTAKSHNYKCTVTEFSGELGKGGFL